MLRKKQYSHLENSILIRLFSLILLRSTNLSHLPAELMNLLGVGIQSDSTPRGKITQRTLEGRFSAVEIQMVLVAVTVKQLDPASGASENFSFCQSNTCS